MREAVMYRVRVVVPMAIAILMGPLVGHVGAQGAAVALTATRLDPVAGEISDANPNLVGMANGVPIFQISQSATGQEFWSLTPSGLTILKDIAPGSNIQSVIYAFPEFYVANAEGNFRAVDGEYTRFDFEDSSH